MKKGIPNLYFQILVVVILVGGFYLLLHKSSPSGTPAPEGTEQTQEKVSPAPTQPVALIDKSLIEEEKDGGGTKYASVTLTYPQFKNASLEFNEKIKKTILDAIADHNKNAEENWQARYENRLPGENTPQYPAKADLLPLTITWTPIQVNASYISLIVSMDEYSGGAHGSQSVTSFNYDVKKKKDVSLKDLFPNDSNYLKTLSDFSRKALEAQFRKALNVKTKEDEANFKESIMPMLLEGTKPTLDNFNTFTFTPTTINIYFAEYQVGPYVLGAPKVSFARR